MNITNCYTYIGRFDSVKGSVPKYEGSDTEKDINDLVKKRMDYIDMEYARFFPYESERRTLAFVKGGKGYYSYFTTVSKKLSLEDYRKKFEERLEDFFREAVDFVDNDVHMTMLETGHNYGVRECEWTLDLPGNDGEIIIEFNSQSDQSDIPWHTLNIVSEEE